MRNLTIGSIVIAGIAHLTKTHAILFLLYFLLNGADTILGVILNGKKGSFDSRIFRSGVLKKVGYWIVIALSFLISVFFTNLGTILGVSLEKVCLLGWFVLSAFAFVEVRSIVANLKSLGVVIPPIFEKVLYTTEKTLGVEEDTDGTLTIGETGYTLALKDESALSNQKSITLSVVKSS